MERGFLVSKPRGESGRSLTSYDSNLMKQPNGFVDLLTAGSYWEFAMSLRL